MACEQRNSQARPQPGLISCSQQDSNLSRCTPKMRPQSCSKSRATPSSSGCEGPARVTPGTVPDENEVYVHSAQQEPLTDCGYPHHSVCPGVVRGVLMYRTTVRSTHIHDRRTGQCTADRILYAVVYVHYTTMCVPGGTKTCLLLATGGWHGACGMGGGGAGHGAAGVVRAAPQRVSTTTQAELETSRLSIATLFFFFRPFPQITPSTASLLPALSPNPRPHCCCCMFPFLSPPLQKRGAAAQGLENPAAVAGLRRFAARCLCRL